MEQKYNIEENLNCKPQDGLEQEKFQMVGCFPPKTPSKPNTNKGNQNKIKNSPNAIFGGKHPKSTPRKPPTNSILFK